MTEFENYTEGHVGPHTDDVEQVFTTASGEPIKEWYDD